MLIQSPLSPRLMGYEITWPNFGPLLLKHSACSGDPSSSLIFSVETTCVYMRNSFLGKRGHQQTGTSALKRWDPGLPGQLDHS